MPGNHGRNLLRDLLADEQLHGSAEVACTLFDYTGRHVATSVRFLLLDAVEELERRRADPTSEFESDRNVLELVLIESLGGVELTLGIFVTRRNGTRHRQSGTPCKCDVPPVAGSFR